MAKKKRLKPKAFGLDQKLAEELTAKMADALKGRRTVYDVSIATGKARFYRYTREYRIGLAIIDGKDSWNVIIVDPMHNLLYYKPFDHLIGLMESEGW